MALIRVGVLVLRVEDFGPEFVYFRVLGGILNCDKHCAGPDVRDSWCYSP